MPIIPGVLDTFSKLGDFYRKKNDDYAGEYGAFFNFEFCEHISSLFKNARDKVYAVFVAVKLARLAVCLSKGSTNNESIEDSFDDLILYSTIWKSDFMERNRKNNISDIHVVRETPRE